MSNNQKHRDGFVCKLKAMDWFVSKGYWIFDETNQGPIDFIAINIEGDIQFVECKKLAIRQGEWKPGTRINRVLSGKQKQLNKNFKGKQIPPIKLLYVNQDTGEVHEQRSST